MGEEGAPGVTTSLYYKCVVQGGQQLHNIDKKTPELYMYVLVAIKDVLADLPSKEQSMCHLSSRSTRQWSN